MDEALQRLEQKVDLLMQAVTQLASMFAVDDEEDDHPERTLDGEPAGRERDQNQGL